MGKTSKPLVILLHPQLAEFFEEEREAGHTLITTLDGDHLTLDQVDLAIGPNCWRMTPDLLKHKAIAIRAGRKAREDKKK